MEINYNKNLVEIWVSNSEKSNPEFLESLKPKFKEWKSQKLLPIVYFSGECDLSDKTSELLVYNRKRSVEQSYQLEKQENIA